MKISQLNYDRYKSALFHIKAAANQIGDTPAVDGLGVDMWKDICAISDRILKYLASQEVED